MNLINLITFNLIWLFIATPWAAERKTPKKPVKPEPVVQEASNPSLEELAQRIRKSIVIIQHEGRDGAPEGVGAGFLVSSNGLIATSLHVIGEARRITVRLPDKSQHEVASIEAWDRNFDLALIRINVRGLPFLALGKAEQIKQGAEIFAFGHPQGYENSLVQGMISALRQFEEMEMIQVAMPVEPGNSGGPIFTRQGEVLGILNLKSVITPNLGFATPVEPLKMLLKKPNPVPIERWLTIGALDPRAWKPLMGARWRQRAGRLQVEGQGSGFGGRSLCLSTVDVPETPFELAVNVRLDDESGAAGLVFASDEKDKHFGFYPTGGQLRLTRFDGPDVFSWTILEQKKSSAYQPGQWNEIKVRIEPDSQSSRRKVICFVNQEQVFAWEGELPAGKVGLAKFRQTKASFKDFQIGSKIEAAQRNEQDWREIQQHIQELSSDSSAAALAKVSPFLKDPMASQKAIESRARQLEQEAARLRKLASQVHAEAIQKELLEQLRKPEPDIHLFEAALLVARLDDPELDSAASRQQMDRLSSDLNGVLKTDAPPEKKLQRLIEYMFLENGFHGSRTDYYNAANSYINQVLEDREGLPLTLSIIFMELAKRVGLDHIEGAPLPGHFMVRYAPPGKPAEFVDVFQGGVRLSRVDLAPIVFDQTGGPLLEEHLATATKKDIVVRMLRNLLNIALKQEATTDKSLRYLNLILAIAPESAEDRLKRAILFYQSGDQTAAKQDLDRLLEEKPRGLDMERLEEFMREVSGAKTRF